MGGQAHYKGGDMNADYIADALTLVGAIVRQVELWQRTPVNPETEEGRAELIARHERVRKFMGIVQVEADALRPPQ